MQFYQRSSGIVARLGRLRAGGDGLCFGRTDAADGTRMFVGRLGLLDDDLDPLLIDWRAPAARPFYTATTANPEGLVRRRHFHTRGRAVLDAHDDVLTRDGAHGSAGSDAALLAVLDAPRTGGDARHREHDPGRAGRDHPPRAHRPHRDRGRAGHREDGRGAAAAAPG